MKINLRDSGTSGTYRSGTSSFSSATYARYKPTAPDFNSEFYRRLRKWRFDTLTISSADEILNHDDFRAIVGMGERAIPFIINELLVRPDLLVAALTLITRENPVDPSKAGDIQAMSQAWIDWYEQNK